MIEKIYHLSSCNTCQRIRKELDLLDDPNTQDLKETHITEKALDELYKQVGSYEALINKRAVMYRELKLKEMDLEDADYRKWILHHYTLIKRPIILVDGEAYVGNSKKTVEALKEKLHG